MKLDHSIFSFTDLDALSIDAPRHIIPHITRVGTVVWRPSIGNDFDITTKAAVRDIVALCKAKGINEIFFWGNPDSESNGKLCDNTTNATNQDNWNSTNDLLSQVYEYTLRDVWFNSAWIGASNTTSMLFSEEHTHDFAPNTSPSNSTVQFTAEFETGSISAIGNSYTLTTEVIDGGGPWADASYDLEIYNYKLAAYQTISDAPAERFSSSTRRAEFTDTDSDSHSNEWARTFDDQNSLGTNDTVHDRKLINAWENFSLPIGSSLTKHYTSNGKMKLRITATHTTLLQVGLTADPLRVDLVQLYETECENNNIASSPQPLLGDMNGDMQIDASDLMDYMQEFVSNPSLRLDLNNDGIIDLSDMKIMNELID